MSSVAKIVEKAQKFIKNGGADEIKNTINLGREILDGIAPEQKERIKSGIKTGGMKLVKSIKTGKATVISKKK